MENFPRLHPRHFLVANAENEFNIAFLKAIPDGIAFAEVIAALAGATREIAHRAVKATTTDTKTPLEEKIITAITVIAESSKLTNGETFSILATQLVRQAGAYVSVEREKN